MKLSGYVTIDEISEALNLPADLIAEDFEEVGLDCQLTLFGEPHYLARYVDRWMHDRANAIKAWQDKRAATVRLETTGTITNSPPYDGPRPDDDVKLNVIH